MAAAFTSQRLQTVAVISFRTISYSNGLKILSVATKTTFLWNLTCNTYLCNGNFYKIALKAFNLKTLIHFLIGMYWNLTQNLDHIFGRHAFKLWVAFLWAAVPSQIQIQKRTDVLTLFFWALPRLFCVCLDLWMQLSTCAYSKTQQKR